MNRKRHSYGLGALIGASLVSMASTPVFAKAPACEDLGIAQARFEITSKGIEKLAKRVVPVAVPLIRSKLEGKVFGETVNGKATTRIVWESSAKKCTPEYVAKLKVTKSWSECFGVPYYLFSKEHHVGKTDQQLERDLDRETRTMPARIVVDNLTLRDLDLGEPKIDCKDLSCDVEVDVKYIRFDGDLDVSPLAAKGKKPAAGKNTGPASKETYDSFSVKGWSASMRSGDTPEKTGKLRFQVKLSPEQGIEKTLRFGATGPAGAKGLNAYIPQGSLKLDLVMKNEAEIKKLESTAIVGKDVREKGFYESYQAQMQKALGSRFNSGDSMRLYLALMNIVNQKAAQNPVVLETIARKVAGNLAPKIQQKVQDAIAQQGGIRTARKVTLPPFDFQDVTDRSKWRKQVELQEKLAKSFPNPLSTGSWIESDLDPVTEAERFLASFEGSSDPFALELLQDLREQWNQAAKRQGSPGDRSKAERLVAQIDKLFNQILAKGEKLKETIAVRMVAAQAGELNQSLQVALGVCRGCGHGQLDGISPSQFSKFRAEKNHDVAAQVSLKAINSALAQLYLEGKLRVCLNLKEKDRSCRGALDPDQPKDFYGLGKPPVVGWDAAKGFYVDVPYAYRQRESKVGVVDTADRVGGRVYFKLTPSEDGRKLAAHMTDVEGKYLDSNDPSGNSTSPLHEIFGPMAVWFATNLFEDMILQQAQANLSIPEFLRIQEIQGSPESISMYGDLEPNFPLDFKDKGLRAGLD